MKNISNRVNKTETIVIAGAGFGGIIAALKLEKRIRRLERQCRIVLIDKNPYQLYTPALYEIAAIPREEASAYALKSSVAIPLDQVLDKKRIAFLQAEITGIDKEHRAVTLQDGSRITYRWLVLALGSTTNYFAIPGLQEHAFPLKTFSDAVRIRNKLETMLIQTHALNVVIGGGGASGVELIAEFANFICYLQHKVAKEHLCKNRLTLVESAPDILPGFDSWMVAHARKRLQSQGIEICTNTLIVEVSDKEIVCKDGGRIPYDLFIWTGGVTGLPLYASFGLPTSKKHNLVVNEFLQAAPGIYAIGDAAGFTDPSTNTMLVWNVPVAEGQARAVADNIVRELKQLPLRPFKPLARYPFILAVGKKYALADLLFLRCAGLSGWVIKLLVELRYLLFILPFGKAIRTWMWSVRVYVSND
ncbi:MAG: NAD(P)/FAD-dependent oxidoreductase [Candidatus Sungbacteria bacterium]|nr:NAD(P)/FAD-dependent oxidoreductase [Candidatus Sungbacteria bacterium]